MEPGGRPNCQIALKNASFSCFRFSVFHHLHSNLNFIQLHSSRIAVFRYESVVNNLHCCFDFGYWMIFVCIACPGGGMAVAEGVAKLLYIVVVEDDAAEEDSSSFRYTRSVLQTTLQLMGCKARHAFKVSYFL